MHSRGARITQRRARRRNDASGTDLRAGTRVLESDSDKRRRYESRWFRRVRSETLMRVRFEDVVWGDGKTPEGIEIRLLDRDKDMEGCAVAYAEGSGANVGTQTP